VTNFLFLMFYPLYLFYFRANLKKRYFVLNYRTANNNEPFTLMYYQRENDSVPKGTGFSFFLDHFFIFRFLLVHGLFFSDY